MRKKIGWRYAVGAAVAATVTIFVIAVFFSLCVTDKADISLADTADERFDWSYELLDDGKIKPYEPVFEDDVFTVKIPDGVKAVRITRTMTEDIPGAELEWNSYDYGVEVFLDGELLHSDFHNARRGEGGFLGLTQNDWDEYSREHGSELQRVRMSLPVDYKGKELSVVTYFPNDAEFPAPEYPSVGNVDSCGKCGRLCRKIQRHYDRLCVYGFFNGGNVYFGYVQQHTEWQNAVTLPLFFADVFIQRV